MGIFLACKSLLKQEQMCVNFPIEFMYILIVNFIFELLKEVLIMGFVLNLSDIDV